MIRNHEQCVYWEIKYEDYENDWNILKTRESSKILTHRAVMTVPTFLTKLLLPRVQENLAAKMECAKNTREYVYSWKRFWSSTCSTKSWRITQWFKKFGGVIGDSEDRRTWEKWERRTVAINTFTLLFSKSKEKKSTRQKKSYVYDLPCRGWWDLYS